jgi:hypothetical protein
MFLKVIACEIAVRELQHTASRSKNLVDLDFLSQGHHDTPASGREEIQQRINAVPPGKYDRIVIGYALCSSILAGLTAADTPLVIPRAHDCITFFMGSRERYERHFAERPGTYYYTSGWLECQARRGAKASRWTGASLPAHSNESFRATYAEWVKRFGEEQAKYLLQEMGRWADHYSYGCHIHFDFLQQLELGSQVKRICSDRGWEYEEIPGDLSLFEKMVDGPWNDSEFLSVQPGQKVVATYDSQIIGVAD